MPGSRTPAVMNALYVFTPEGVPVSMTGLGWLVTFAPLAVVLLLSFGMQRMSVQGAQAAFWAYAALMGLSLSSIFLVYTGASIAQTFFITAGMFGGMSLYGYSTKRDLTGVGHFCIMAVWGLILASIVNIFLRSPGLNFAVSAIGVVVFVGLTAYDTQRLKGIYYQVAGSAQAAAKASIFGALQLYLDFINLFLMLLRFMGDRR
jgi:FtsH-binding integral membrane protein